MEIYNNKLKCFIACAFGKKDIEKIYNAAILKVLSKLKIIPLRVDKVEHNDNIDLKIIELINQCDFWKTYERSCNTFRCKGGYHGI